MEKDINKKGVKTMTTKHKDGMKEYTLEELSKLKPKCIVKQFTVPQVYKQSSKVALCQVEGCKEIGAWFVQTKNKKCILLCFGHGEDY